MIDEFVHALEATVEDAITRVATIGDRGTAGPPVVEQPVVDPAHPLVPSWLDGYWSGARRVAAHVGRVGGAIRPCATVVHTTDMLPDEWDALLKAWSEKPGDGACAHFLIGRDEAHGIVQFVPITRNGNHAGGPGHGVFKTGAGAALHPNTIAVGIEVHCAGGVRLVNGQWRLVENGVAHGAPLPAADVTPDPQRPGRGWHNVTDYQRRVLAALLDDLELALASMPAGLQALSTGEAVPAWGVPKSARVVGHVSLDPAHRSDPWPAQMAFLNAR